MAREPRDWNFLHGPQVTGMVTGLEEKKITMIIYFLIFGVKFGAGGLFIFPKIS